MDKIARAQSLIAAAGMLYNGIKHIKESPKMSIAKSLLCGYLIYAALSGKQAMGAKTGNIIASA